MSSIRYGVSPWTDAVPVKKRPEFPAYRGVSTAAAVIVGGGMAGAMTAYACAAAGVKVILLEANRIGLGGSGRATGFLSSEASESYRRARDEHADAAREPLRNAIDARDTNGFFHGRTLELAASRAALLKSSMTRM